MKSEPATDNVPTSESDRGSETIVRVHRRDYPYVQVDRRTAQDKRLSWEARGLLVYLLSLPTDWQITVSHLRKEGDAGRDAVRRILRELQKHGYASGFGKPDGHDEEGLFASSISVYETPELNPRFRGEGSPTPEKASSDYPTPENPSSGRPTPEKASAYKSKTRQRKDFTDEDLNKTPPPARQRATSAPRDASAEGEGASRTLTLEDFIACVEAEAKTPAGATIRNVEHVARGRWNRGRPAARDVERVRAFLAGEQSGAEASSASSPAAESAGPVSVRSATRSCVLSFMKPPCNYSQAAAVDEAVKLGRCTEGERALLLNEDLSALLARERGSTPSASPASPEPLRLVQPAAGAR